MRHFSFYRFEREISCAYRDETYLVRDNGSIWRHMRSGGRKRPRDEEWTFGAVCKYSGYLKISSEAVHRIVATAFLGEPPSKTHVVDHIDTNRRNNRPENLRWVTRLENILLNPITARRIIDAYGSIEDFLKDPSRSLVTPLDQSLAWMRAVTAAEAQASLERMLSWAHMDGGQKTYSVGEWTQRRGSKVEETSLSDGNTKPSLTPACAQRNWRTPTEFPRCPLRRDLKSYAAELSIGEVFSRNEYVVSTVSELSWTPDDLSLLVLTRMIESGPKHWAIAQITLEDDMFVHTNCGSFFTEEGAQKRFTLALRREWTGGDTIDDYC